MVSKELYGLVGNSQAITSQFICGSRNSITESDLKVLTVTWEEFQDLTFDAMAEDHIEELWYAYNRLSTTIPKEFLPLIYEHTTKDKIESMQAILDWLEIDMPDDQVESIAQKNHQRSDGNRRSFRSGCIWRGKRFE